MSDDPESPSFHRKVSNISQKKTRNEFSDIQYWKLPLQQIDGLQKDAVLVNNNTTRKDQFQENTGVNGTVRRYLKGTNEDDISRKVQPHFQPDLSRKLALKISSKHLAQSAGIVPLSGRNVVMPPQKIKRSISKTFVQDSLKNGAVELVDSPKEKLHAVNTSQKIEQVVVVMQSATKDLPQKLRSHEILAEKEYIAAQAQRQVEMDAIRAEKGRISALEIQTQRQALHVEKERIAAQLELERQVLKAQELRTERLAQKVENDRLAINNLQKSNGRIVESQTLLTTSMSNVSKKHKIINDMTSNETLNPLPSESSVESTYRQEKTFFKITQLIRAISMTTHTWITAWPGLNDPRVAALNGKGLLITILVFSMLDVILCAIKLWPKNLWCFWSVKNWDPVLYLGSIWSIVADHSLILDVVPMFANVTLRIYSYRLAELIINPKVLDTISNNSLSLDTWSDPSNSNFVQLVLWGCSIGITLVFHTFLRARFFFLKYSSASLALIISLKALLLLLDMVSSALFLYSFLVTLRTQIFGKSPDITLMLVIIIGGPVISTICNSLINIPLLYSFFRLEKGRSHQEVLYMSFSKVFSPFSLILSVLALFYIAIMSYLLNRIQLIEVSANVDSLVNLVAWSPKQIVIWLIGFNFAINYLAGMAFATGYWLLKLFGCIMKI